MTTKQRFRNNKYRLEVRERDHGPAHVHLAWVAAHHDELMKEWQKWHP